MSGEPGEDAGAVAGFEDELGLGLSDDPVHGDVLKDKVAQGLRAFGGYVEVKSSSPATWRAWRTPGTLVRSA